MAKPDSRLILSLNAGSSSLKISLYAVPSTSPPHESRDKTPDSISLVLTSSISNISTPPAQFKFHLQDPTAKGDTDVNDSSGEISDHASAFQYFLKKLDHIGINHERIVYICHRVVHGGDYNQPITITERSYHHIEKLSDLAPLHNGAALSVMQACMKALPTAESIAYFDTSFHCTIPPHISSYAIDQDIAEKRGLKKYGFHGISYSFILRTVSRFLQKQPDNLNLIILHLGSGASACAVKNGKSLDTSMGLTPLNGLPGATRSGSIDPSLIFHYTNKAGRITHDPSMAADVQVTMAEEILNRKSGWKAITGTTDFGEITSHAELNNPDPEIAAHNPHRLAFDLFLDRVLHYIGAYHLKLGGEVDALVFAGGIGEKGVELRSIISERVGCLGYRKLDEEQNKNVGSTDDTVTDISLQETEAQHRARRILVCKTDEQIEMARQCALDHSSRDKER